MNQRQTKLRKGTLLAGGSATQLHLVTQVMSKRMLPMYGNSMINYPLTTLMLADIRNVLLIAAPQDTFRALSNYSVTNSQLKIQATHLLNCGYGHFQPGLLIEKVILWLVRRVDSSNSGYPHFLREFPLNS